MDLGSPDHARRRAALLDRVDPVLPHLAAMAAARDETGDFPEQEFDQLRAAGVLVAPLPEELGGLGIGSEPAGGPAAFTLLRRIGAASLPIGRVFEGHLNALRLICRLGSASQRRQAASDAAAGHLFGVWNTDPAVDGLRIEGDRLAGAKILASGAGFVTRALVTDGSNPRALLLVRLGPGERAALGGWTAQGMRASATGRVDFSGLDGQQWERIGAPGGYLEQPDFSGGAWRVCAVQLGGLDAVVAALRDGLRERGRADDPHQLARVGTALIAQQGAALFVRRAAELAEDPRAAAGDVVAYVGLARIAVETACLDALRLAQRSLGLTAFLRPAAIERIGRDLATYLRQPVPDAVLGEAASWFMARELP